MDSLSPPNLSLHSQLTSLDADDVETAGVATAVGALCCRRPRLDVTVGRWACRPAGPRRGGEGVGAAIC
jgi:hypothetical protein